jgi:hypothetical protein
MAVNKKSTSNVNWYQYDKSVGIHYTFVTILI